MIGSIGCPAGTDGRIRFCVVRSTFSGIERNEGMEYLETTIIKPSSVG